MSATTPPRPALTPSLGAEEFSRWYWTTAELAAFAGELGVARRGPKAALTERIRARLAGERVEAPPPVRRNRLVPPLSRATVIPGGLVLSRGLRDWFIAEVGPGFRANDALRRFLAEEPGRTLGDALDCYLATRHGPSPAIGEQFEYNAFVRAWWERHPGGSAEALRSAWARWRATPADER